MNKKAQFTSAWPTAYNLIREMNLVQNLPPMNKIKLDSSRPENPNAFGFVTTEDSDDNGTLDTMHIVVPNIDQHLGGISASELTKLKIDDPNRLKQILLPIIELITHEQGHQKDYRHGEEDPFPGGEGVADMASQQAINRIPVQATNNLNKNDTKRSFTMKKEIISRLVKLSSDLDKKGAYNLSEDVIALANKFAQESLWTQSAKNFSTATNLAPGPNLDGVALVQQQLLNMGFDIGSKTGTPDKLWGPKTTEAFRLFTERYQHMLEGMNKTPEEVAKNLEHLMVNRDAGDLARKMKSLSRIMDFSDSAKASHPGDPDLSHLELTEQQKENIRSVPESVPPEEELDAGMSVSSYADDAPEDLSHLKLTPEQKANIKSVTEAVPTDSELDANFEGVPTASADDDLETEAKGVNDLTKNASFNAVFWKQNVKTPFGR